MAGSCERRKASRDLTERHDEMYGDAEVEGDCKLRKEPEKGRDE